MQRLFPLPAFRVMFSVQQIINVTPLSHQQHNGCHNITLACVETKKESAFPPEAEKFGDKKKMFFRRRRKIFDDIDVFDKHGEGRILEKIEAKPMDPRLGTRV